MPKVLFLPGASGDAAFWQPVADRLPRDWPKTLLRWPGLGNQPSSADINGWNDLCRLVEQRIDGKVALVGQSMGGMLALRAALEHPESVSHLVLTATSGGIDLTRFDLQDWRDDYRRSFPHAADWIYERPPVFETELRSLAIPTLLIWATGDPISPPAIGRHLEALMPHASLVELVDDSHLFARDRADDVAPLIEGHLGKENAEEAERAEKEKTAEIAEIAEKR